MFKKGKKQLAILAGIAFIPLFVIGLFAWINWRTPVIRVENQIADTTSKNPADGPFILTGQWERFAGSYLPQQLDGQTKEVVEDIQFIRKMRGYTYTFTLTGKDLEEWYFLLPRPHSSRLWLNGTEVLGEEGRLSSDEVYRFRDYTDEDSIRIVLQVTNFSIYDVYQGILIGSRSCLTAIQTCWIVLDLVAAGMSAMLILMCLGLFLPKRSETYLLLLALSTLAELGHFLLITRSPRLSFFHLGTTTFYRQLGFVNYYVCQQFVPGKSWKWMDRAVPAVALVTAAACFLWPAYRNNWIQASYLFYMAVQAVILGRGVWHRIPEVPVIMIGCMLALGNELFYRLLYAGMIPQGIMDIEIMPAQYMRFAYIVTLALATCMKYGKKFCEAEQLSEQLEQKVAEQTEELRQTNAKLIQTQQTRQRFMTDMVHNLRSPLFALGGYLDLLRDELVNPTEEQEKYLDMLDRKTEYIGKMTDDMFLVYRLEEGQLNLERESFDLSQLLLHVCQDGAVKGQEKKLHVELSGAEKPLFYVGDRFRLKQAFDNILDNAVRYSPTEGHIAVSLTKTGIEWRVCVSDQGPGISCEQQKRLFVRYESKGNGGKTGLGLSISNYIVQMHGGRIQVESEPGQGAAVAVYLPCENFNGISTESLP